MSKPALSAIWADVTNARRISSISALLTCSGTWFFSDHGTGEGPTTVQLPSSKGSSEPSQPSLVDPLGPECPNWIPIFAEVLAWTKSTIRVHSRTWSSVYNPVQPGV